MSLKGRYLVTGGAGFIGSHLCETLVDSGAQVVAIDNLITGRHENLKNLLKSRSFDFVERDITLPLEIPGELSGIFHMASPASPIDYAKYPIETLRVGALGGDHVLRIALEKKCRILVASTSEVYGDPLEHPQREEYYGNVNPVGPRGCYDESKRYLEALTMAYKNVHGVNTCIIRIFNTYGPRMRTNDGRVVPNFCIQALRNENLTVYGNGSQTRSFCYIDDLIEGILLAMMSNEPGPLNLGNPEETTILDFARRIIKLSGRPLDVTYMPLPQDDPKSRKPDITKAMNQILWKPKTGLDDGLKNTFDYFKSQC